MANTARTSGYAPVNGINLYYEIHGTGKPLVLLHGGVGAIEMFGPVRDLLAQGRQVIGVDLQARGRTESSSRPMAWDTMADDIGALIKFLGLPNADVMGYSLGFGVAPMTAIRHPDLVNKLVLASTPFAQNGWHAENLAGMAQLGAAMAEPMKQTPMYALYAQIAPKVEDWPVLWTQIGDLPRPSYDWSAEVKALKMPVMIVVGDYDSVKISHATQFFELLGGGQKDAGWDGSGMTPARFAVLPGLTHYTIVTDPTLAITVVPSLDA